MRIFPSQYSGAMDIKTTAEIRIAPFIQVPHTASREHVTNNTVISSGLEFLPCSIENVIIWEGDKIVLKLEGPR
jgi:hypothetical protein